MPAIPGSWRLASGPPWPRWMPTGRCSKRASPGMVAGSSGATRPIPCRATEQRADRRARRPGWRRRSIAAFERELARIVERLGLAGQVAQPFVELQIGQRVQRLQVRIVRPSGEQDRQIGRVGVLGEGHRGERDAGDVDGGGAPGRQARESDFAVGKRPRLTRPRAARDLVRRATSCPPPRALRQDSQKSAPGRG